MSASGHQRKYATGVLSVLLGGYLILQPVHAASTVIYVAPNGDDQSSGQQTAKGPDGPVLTITRALERIRTLRQQNKGGAYEIDLLPGKYRIAKPILIGHDDSGTADAPLIIDGLDRAKVIVSGARNLEDLTSKPDPAISDRIPKSARSHVLTYDLHTSEIPWVGPVERGAGITDGNSEYASELFVNGIPAVMARWPKDDYAKLKPIPGDRKAFQISPAPPETWNFPDDFWAYGFWGNDYDDDFLRVHRDETRRLIFQGKYPPSGMRENQRVMLTNLPEALDSPGEWYLDSARGKVYLLPPSSSSPQVELSIARNIFVLQDASNVAIRNMTIEGSREDLVRAVNDSDITVDNCLLRNAGRGAVYIAAGTRSGVSHSDIINVGGTGIRINGGDRKTLQPGNNFASDNRISKFGRLFKSYQPGVMVDGVGGKVEHNLIYDAPHAAIVFAGNDHQIAYNEIHHVVSETGDAGAIYTGREWAGRGTVIENNYFHDIQGYGPVGAVGVYIDDQGSGVTIYRNLFVRVRQGVEVGGGVDNAINRNLFVRGAGVHIDNRGMTWERGATLDPKGSWLQNLNAVPYKSPTYIEHYPNLAKLQTDGLGIPMRNQVGGNLAVGSEVTDFKMPAEILKLQQIGENWSTNDAQTVWEHPPDLITETRVSAFNVSTQSQWVKAGFSPLNLSGVGVR